MFGMLNASTLAATAPNVVKKALRAPAAIGDEYVKVYATKIARLV
jgi:hypothetical protein